MWLQKCYLKSCEVYSIDPQQSEGDVEGYKSGYSKENFRVQSFLKPDAAGSNMKAVTANLNQLKQETDICAKLKLVHAKNIQPFTIQSRTKLQSSSSE